MRYIAVVDIGKTNAKVALVDLVAQRESVVRTRPNTVDRRGLYPHFDVDSLWRFILASLTDQNRESPIDAIAVTTHGATAALLSDTGELALPVLDYEYAGPEQVAADYDAIRPAFHETGSPRLPIGLNLGAQIFWQARAFPHEFARVASIVMYPQYWAYRLCGVLVNEMTSLGCHTDLWNPERRDFSSLTDSQGWRKLMAPVRLASEQLGPVLPDIASETGVHADTPVFCGIHDSNASLLPHLLFRKPPFAVVSTGTWVVSMAVRAKQTRLDPARDTLINVNALGDPVPSARFMGGREFDILTRGQATEWSEADVLRVLDRQIMLLPSVQQGSGPFPDARSSWSAGDAITDAERTVAASFYLAMMTATCLDLIGADGPTIIEGPLARNTAFARMLASATARPTIGESRAATGTSIGAALLVAPPTKRPPYAAPYVWRHDSLWSPYAAAWNATVKTRR